MPAVKVEIAFASNPTGGSYTWVDVSANVRKIQIRRGRQHVLNKFEPGSCTILFNARDGSLDPTNPSSPYYPNVDINRRIRIRAGASLTPIFTGFTDAWTPKWPNNVSADVEMTATDGLRLLAKGTFASSQYATQVLADSPQNFVPMTGIPPAAVTQLLYGALPPLAFTTLYDSVYPGDVNGTWALLEPYVAGVSGTSYVDPSTAVILSGGSLIGVESGSPAQVKVITSTSEAASPATSPSSGVPTGACKRTPGCRCGSSASGGRSPTSPSTAPATASASPRCRTTTRSG
jgi:hypothetical protein